MGKSVIQSGVEGNLPPPCPVKSRSQPPAPLPEGLRAFLRMLAKVGVLAGGSVAQVPCLWLPMAGGISPGLEMMGPVGVVPAHPASLLSLAPCGSAPIPLPPLSPAASPPPKWFLPTPKSHAWIFLKDTALSLREILRLFPLCVRVQWAHEGLPQDPATGALLCSRQDPWEMRAPCPSGSSSESWPATVRWGHSDPWRVSRSFLLSQLAPKPAWGTAPLPPQPPAIPHRWVLKQDPHLRSMWLLEG